VTSIDPWASAVAVDPQDGAVLAVRGALGVRRIDRFTGAHQLLGGDFSSPEGIVVDAFGSIAVVDADTVDPVMVRLDARTGQVTARVGVPPTPRGIALASNDDLVIACSGFGSQARVVRVARLTLQQTVVANDGDLTGSFGGPLGVAVESAGTILAIRDLWEAGGGMTWHRGIVVRVNPDTGQQTRLTERSELAEPRSIAVAADGAVLVAATAGVFTVHPGTGVPARLPNASGARIAVVPPLGTP
jgi:DNA-binding beta-propeller fold protein YncE